MKDSIYIVYIITCFGVNVFFHSHQQCFVVLLFYLDILPFSRLNVMLRGSINKKKI